MRPLPPARLRTLTTAAALGALIAACEAPTATSPGVDVAPAFSVGQGSGNVLDLANATLEARGSEYRIAYAEYLTAAGSGRVGTVIFARDVGNKQLAFDFIPDDPRRGGADGDPNTIDVWVDLTQGATSNGLGAGTTTAAIGRSVGTWDAATCSEFSPNFIPVEVDLGLVQSILGFGGTFTAVSDIMHAGWLPGAFFDLLAQDGSTFILGVTFTLTFTSGDLDGNGLPDLGAREIYYNDAFPWADDGVSHFDVETVALHEGGHGLSQAHFGTIFQTLRNGVIHFAPRAVMNAAYSGVQRSLSGTDDAGHCSLWASWPQK